ncbi:DUF1700 domain-containing protein [Limosilactobacillus vaginalis]|uniref:DUF1700 domain-containing protein n=1 Tax=Limosilactobacillus vaginalis TaxID=1633 RepID=A0AAW5WSN5_9LACO|nr:DUF1700 domain-containing protein [Limosilactobacillus vaginalis]MCZ3667473.1 DUF1700 domain-containing protein [Limosilactobacillus vaginalis]MDM8261846.1 DUF1700 domain-containing protein [Limosilactobacillus vaginalis]MDM8303270.1 DUF1700 domain-containing protein [Limosilactobacillus vaginalis]
MDGRQKYISELKKLLAPLTVEERTDALDFYNEYIEDAGYNSYQQIVKEMGNPRQLSHKILADYSIKANDEETKSGHTASPHSSWRVFWLIIIAIVTSPITFALSLGALVVLICALAAVFGVSVGILGTLAGLVFAAGVLLYSGIGVVVAAPMTGILYIGFGITILGILLFCIPLVYWIIRWLAQAIANLAKYIYQKLVQRRAEKHEKNV